MKIFANVDGCIHNGTLAYYRHDIVCLKGLGQGLSAFPFRISENDNGFFIILQPIVSVAHYIKSVLSKENSHFCRGSRFSATVQYFDVAIVVAYNVYFLFDFLFAS